MDLISASDPVLHRPSSEIPEISDELKAVVKDMFDIMHEQRGVGLAAPQVGIQQRFFLINYGGQKIVCIDPKIIEFSEETVLMEEGCLSYPGQFVRLSRPAEVRVEYIDLTGKRKKTRFTKMKARIFQHELDHLHGITFMDRAQADYQMNQSVTMNKQAPMG